MLESADLIRRFHAGDTGVFELFIEEHQEDVYTFCLRNCGDTGLSERLAEKIFLSAHQALHRQAPDTPIRQWLLQRTIDFLVDVEYPESPEAPLTDKQSKMVNAVLKGLDPPFRFAVILRDVLNIDEVEVAEILNLPLGTARSRIHRGRLTIARSLAKELEA